MRARAGTPTYVRLQTLIHTADSGGARLAVWRCEPAFSRRRYPSFSPQFEQEQWPQLLAIIPLPRKVGLHQILHGLRVENSRPPDSLRIKVLTNSAGERPT